MNEGMEEAKKLVTTCEENPKGSMNQFWVEKIEKLVRDSGGTFEQLGTTAERLRQLSGQEY